MFSQEVTFFFDFADLERKYRQFILHAFAQAGAKHLVLSDTLIENMFREPALQAEFPEDLKTEGLTFLDAHAPFGQYLDLNCLLPEYRKLLIEHHKFAIALAAALGTETITIHVGNPRRIYGEATMEQMLDSIRRGLDTLLPYAEECGITIAIENIWFPTNTPDVLLALKKEFPTDALGFCYDSGHAHLMESSSAKFETCAAKSAWNGSPVWEDHALEKMLPHIVNCHLHDNDGCTDQHRNPGNGTIDWRKIIPLLKKAPKLKNVQSEVIPVREKVAIPDLTEAFRMLGGL